MKDSLCSLTSESSVRQASFWECVDQYVRRMVTLLAEKALQFELDVQIRADWNQRSPDRRGHRNGFYRRSLLTPHGPLRIRVPRLRRAVLDTTAVFDRYQRRLADVERLLRHAYLLGTSTRGLAALAEQIFGDAISHQTISRLMRWLDKQLEHWQERPISQVYPVVYIDGMHVDIVGGDRMVMLVMGQPDDGPVEVLGFCISRGEECTRLLKDLHRRGLDDVQLFVSDESGSIRHALEQVFPLVPWQSCTFHRLQRLFKAIGPVDYRNQMVRDAARIFRCPSFGAALNVATDWRRRWQNINPAAVDQFLYELRDSLTFFQLPQKWWKRVRTNNPLERLIKTLRMRLTPMGCFHDEAAIRRAVFGQLLRWSKIKLTHNT